jgi:hypothetical protein
MIKNIVISREHTAQVTSWLKENIGTENVRWWVQDNVWINHTVGFSVSIDLLEEEEPLLTTFLLKWA